MSCRQSVLMIDDDPDHLKIYGWVLEQTGQTLVPCLAKPTGLDLPLDAPIALIILDYALHCALSPEEVAQRLVATYPSAPIVLLSDVWGVPEDVAPYVTEFVRKGEPQKLVSTVARLLHSREQRPN